MVYGLANFHTFRQTFVLFEFQLLWLFKHFNYEGLTPFHTPITLTKQITTIHMNYIPSQNNSCYNCSQHNLRFYMTCHINFDVNAFWHHIHIEICKILTNYALVNILYGYIFYLNNKIFNNYN